MEAWSLNGGMEPEWVDQKYDPRIHFMESSQFHRFEITRHGARHSEQHNANWNNTMQLVWPHETSAVSDNKYAIYIIL